MPLPFSASPKRLLLLGGTAFLLAIILIAKWIGGWGLVTIHVKDAPVGKVMTSIARQGHVRVEGSLDPLKPVTMDIDRVTPAEAVDMLSIRAEASWRIVYLAAPGKADLNAAILQLRASNNVENWASAYYPGFQAGGLGGGNDEVIDPRSLEWKPEGPELDLPKLLDEASQKTGVMTVLPRDWNPAVRNLPKTNHVGKAIMLLVGSVHGKSVELFLLSERGRRGAGAPPDGGDPPQEGGASRPEDKNPQARPPRQTVKQEWMEQRQLAQIKKLRPAQQAVAKKEMDDRKAFFDSLKGLTPEERRAKIQAMMADPAFAEKMQDARLLRDAKQTPEQRITRAVNYINRKTNAKAAAAAKAARGQ
ncbi:MAG: hypothetical protein K8R38_04010 [Verrucomicrobia bacterium]|nr:hypothetical protein [Verrucomicrobiota bacterium]